MVKKKGLQRSTPASSPQIVGATLVAALAGEMIGELTLAITNKLTMHALAEIVHCYPTQAEVFERIALIRMLLLETNEFVERGHVEPQFAQLLEAVRANVEPHRDMGAGPWSQLEWDEFGISCTKAFGQSPCRLHARCW